MAKEKLKAWWEGQKPVYQVGDGQKCHSVFSRKADNSWEYALVTTGDDGTFCGVTILKDGRARMYGESKVDFSGDD